MTNCLILTQHCSPKWWAIAKPETKSTLRAVLKGKSVGLSAVTSKEVELRQNYIWYLGQEYIVYSDEASKATAFQKLSEEVARVLREEKPK